VPQRDSVQAELAVLTSGRRRREGLQACNLQDRGAP
jgi:hypothetical protein